MFKPMDKPFGTNMQYQYSMRRGILNSFFARYVTPLTTGLFLVSAISGIALFFHWAPGTFHAMHEWLSMALLVPFALHMWRNWGAFMLYVKRNTLWIPLILCVAISIPFAMPRTQSQNGVATRRSVLCV